MNDLYQNECRAVSELLIALAADELEPERAAQLHTHLAQCAACQVALAAVQQTHELAAGLKLDSPALDRYPEFLRRLAADEAAPAQQALVQVREAALLDAEPAAQPNSGVAAVVPLFGRRVMLRSGFGKGFELTVVSPRGRELFRLAATSLTRAAAVAAGVSLFAGLSLVGVALLITSLWQAQPKEEQARSQPLPEFPERRALSLPPRNWVQTFSHKDDTLAVWPEGGQLSANWLGVEAPPVMLALAQFEGERLLPPPSMGVAGASDGRGAVVAREGPPGLFAWHVSADAPRRRVELIQPVLIARHGVQPALVWFDDRYLLAFVNPSKTAPHIELLQLDRAGQPLQERGLLAATTEEADKISWPALASAGTQGALFFFTEKGELQGRTLRLEQDRVELGERIHITTKQRRNRTPIRTLALADSGFLLCWGEMEDDRFELRLARLNAQLQPQTIVTLIATAAPVPAFDWRLDEASVSLAWLEEQPDKGQIFTQRFDFDGTALSAPQPAAVIIERGGGLAFADAIGSKLIWTHHPVNEKLRLETMSLR
jgi:anti-sigma factor RsiW